MILCIETATNICSVALCDRGKISFVKESSVDKSHARLLTIFINDLLEKAGIKATSLQAVAISKGPGSYTGLRIGVSTAKGITYGAGIPLIAISTLESMFYGLMEMKSTMSMVDDKTLLCPMLDARRMEVYSALFNPKGEMVKEISAEVIDKDSYLQYLEKGRIIFFGNGAGKCSEVIIHENAQFIPGFELSARFLAIPSTRALEQKCFEDIAYFEPFYLKDFIATIPRKNILGK